MPAPRAPLSPPYHHHHTTTTTTITTTTTTRTHTPAWRPAPQALRESGVPYCVVRPTGLKFEGWPQGRPFLSQGDVAVGRCSAREMPETTQFHLRAPAYGVVDDRLAAPATGWQARNTPLCGVCSVIPARERRAVAVGSCFAAAFCDRLRCKPTARRTPDLCPLSLFLTTVSHNASRCNAVDVAETPFTA